MASRVILLLLSFGTGWAFAPFGFEHRTKPPLAIDFDADYHSRVNAIPENIRTRLQSLPDSLLAREWLHRKAQLYEKTVTAELDAPFTREWTPEAFEWLLAGRDYLGVEIEVSFHNLRLFRVMELDRENGMARCRATEESGVVGRGVLGWSEEAHCQVDRTHGGLELLLWEDETPGADYDRLEILVPLTEPGGGPIRARARNVNAVRWEEAHPEVKISFFRRSELKKRWQIFTARKQAEFGGPSHVTTEAERRSHDEERARDEAN